MITSLNITLRLNIDARTASARVRMPDDTGGHLAAEVELVMLSDAQLTAVGALMEDLALRCMYELDDVQA